MTGRSTLPAMTTECDHPQETLGLLSQRLQNAEQDTRELVDQLSHMGLHTNKKGDGQHDTIMPITPYKMKNCRDGGDNQDIVVARVCKLESAIQTLKLNLLRAQAERDLSKEEKMTANEKLTTTSDAYEKELSKSNRDLVQCRKDLKETIGERRRAQDDVRKLQDMLDEHHSSKAEAMVMIDDLKSNKVKLSRRIGELREEVGRESSLRASLEESHNTLLTRIQEVEATVQHEHDEVKNMNTICNQLKRENLRAKEEAELERSLRLQAEESLTKITAQSGNVQAQMNTLQEDKSYLMTEMNRMRTRYNELIQQLDQTHHLVNDKQSTHEQLEKENKRLYEAMKATAGQNAHLIAKYEEEIESLKTEVAENLQLVEKVKHLSEQLRIESREKGNAVTTSSQLSTRNQDMEETVRLYEKDIEEMRDKHRSEVAELREALKKKDKEKEQIMKDKDSLLDEVNQAVDEMVEERTSLQSQLQQAQIDLESGSQTRHQLEQENRRLLERLAALEEQANASSQVEKAMTEMMEQKNKLAYDKGRLEDRVNELQREMESLAGGHNELVKLRKVATSTGSNYKRSQTELSNACMDIQRLESRVKQQEASMVRKEEDFRLAIQARDEAVQEAQRLMSYIEEVEDKQKHKVGGLERSLGDTRQDNKKVAATLGSIMQSHTQLQFTIEGLQVELGKKDARISHISNDRSQLQNNNRQLQKELENLQSKLTSVETLNATEMGPLRKVIQQCKTDNAKMATSLESFIKSNGDLQGSIQTLKDELEKKTFVIEQLQEVRERESKAQKEQVEMYEQRLENFKEQLNREREKTMKKSSKEVNEVRKQIDDLVSKNGELSRANSDLRHKITEMEYENRDQQDKLSSFKSQIDHLTKIRHKQDESIKGLQAVGDQLEVLGRSNKDYVKKNEHQAKMIRQFTSQMSTLQEELQGLAQTQSDTAAILQQQEEQLSRERHRNDDLKRKYKESKRREKELDGLRSRTEEKLREANNESLMISSNLSDANTWFRSKFETLQGELTKSRTNQAGLIYENNEQKQMLGEEQKKAQETAEKARQMIQASRETISRLADYAQVSQKETTSQMRDMYSKLESERNYALQTEAKYKGLKASSLRHTEQLARELDVLRSHGYSNSDSFNSSGS